MRAITVTIRPARAFHPANSALARASGVERVAVQHIQLLDDETVVLLYQLRGDLERAKEVLTEQSEVLSCTVSGRREGLAFIHARSSGVSQQLLDLPKRYEIALETPIEHVEDDGVRVTLIGEQTVLQRAFSTVPDKLDVTVERLGEYQQHPETLGSLLTERQREIALMAVQSGYYEIPRQTTQRELAERLDIAPPTLHEHLRKIERRLFEQL